MIPKRTLIIILKTLKVDGTDDAAEYRDTMDAMTTMGMDTDEQSDVIQIVSGNFKIQKCWDAIIR